jgi:hypothetical protein
MASGKETYTATPKSRVQETKSKEDQVAHIAQEIEDAFQKQKHTVAVWVDMEKAFDKVWKDGLRVKLLKTGVCGKMYNWISHFLSNRTARAQLQGHISKKANIQHGVSQGRVLSPTLLLIYINDITENIRRRVNNSLYADNLPLWISERQILTASSPMQSAL